MFLRAADDELLSRWIHKYHGQKIKFAWFPKKLENGSIIWLELYCQKKDWVPAVKKQIKEIRTKDLLLYFIWWTETKRTTLYEPKR